MPSLPPGIVLIVGAFVALLLRGRARAGFLLALPVISGIQLAGLFGVTGEHLQFTVFDYAITVLRVDKLALCFGLVFHIAAFLAVLFSLRVRDGWESTPALVYAGAAIGAVFAGDLITLFVYWELTAVASAFLVWATRTDRAYRAGMRYLVFQVGSGVILLAGILIHVADGHTLAFNHLGAGTTGTNLILTAFGVKAAFPLLHTWLTDAYPEATPTGAVFLSIFTTKMAVYALARGYAGFDGLVWVGAAMALFPVLYAMVEDDLRRVLAYSLVSQLGFKVAGVGLGTETAINGAVAHSFAGILYLSLLFMTMGAVLTRTGTVRASRLGGLARAMPVTTACCLVGAASISGLPLTSGFVTKSLIITAAAEEHNTVLFVILWIAAAATFLHTGVRLPWLAFFGKSRGAGGVHSPMPMRIAMVATAALCILIGVFPGVLYDLLPYGPIKSPYDVTHVLTQLQVLAFGALAALMLGKAGKFAVAKKGILLDTDWFYRKAAPAVIGAVVTRWRALRKAFVDGFLGLLRDLLVRLRIVSSPYGSMGRTWLTSSSVAWAAVLLTVFLILYFTNPP
ncbi:MAG: Na(+)/H(+) antiporter subunit D [Planctomycetota bacterium]|jgi:multicomponent Na+:H+ antiporter subunit D